MNNKNISTTFILSAVFGLVMYVTPTVSVAQIQYKDVTDLSGPFGVSESWGSSWGDYNNDGFPDLYLSKHRNLGGLYKNNGDGSFTEQTSQVDKSLVWGNNETADTHGYTWADFDNDGDSDLFGAVSNDTVDAQLLVNNNSVFDLESRERNLFDDGRGRMGLWFDYNNDGLLDIGIPTNGFYLYKQDPTVPGNFLKDENAGLACTNLVNYGQLLDTDNNGSLEFLCAREGLFPHKVYDLENSVFQDVTSLFPALSNVNDSTVHDFDGDLRNDIVVTRGRLRPNKAVIVNAHRIEAWLDSGSSVEKGFTFKSEGAITLDPDLALITADNIFIGATGSNPVNTIFTANPSQAMGLKSDQSMPGLYLGFNDATNEWTLIMQPGSTMRGYVKIDTTANASTVKMINVSAAESALKPEIIMNKAGGFIKNTNAGFQAETCSSIASGDFDNDMDVDIYMVCRSGPENIENVLYQNNGNGIFTKVSGAGGAIGILGKGLNSGAGVGENVTVADYDVDGHLDLFVTNGLLMRPEGLGGKHQLFNNMGGTNRWIEIDLIGKGHHFSNRDGIGAKVYVTAGGITQLREQNGGYHRWSQHHQRLHFGLASNTNVTHIKVLWPNGGEDNYYNQSANRLYSIHEAGAISPVSMGSSVSQVSELSVADAYSEESAGAMVFDVTLYPASTEQIKVSYATGNITALSGQDFNANNGELIFFPGETSKQLSINLIDDTEPENTEAFTIELFDAINSTIIKPQATGTITDIDTSAGGLLSQLFINDVTLSESGGSAKFTVTLSPAATSTVTVNYSTMDGTALSGSDYNAKTGTLTFKAGQTSKYVYVYLKNDKQSEGDETYSVLLSNESNALVLDGEGVGTIPANDGGTSGGSTGGGSTGGLPELSIDDISLAESGGSAKFTVTLSPAATSTVTVNYSTMDGTALSGSDYNAKTGTLIFKAGQTSKYVYVYLKNDKQSEGDETYSVLLSNESNALILDGEGVGTILANDGGTSGGSTGGGSTSGLPELSINDISLAESGGSAKFTVRLSPVATSTVTVNYSTMDGTALSGADYNAKTGTLTFKAGQTSKYVYVYLKNDKQSEGDETYSVLLSNESNALILDGEGVGTIPANDGGTSGGSTGGSTVTNMVCGKPAYVASNTKAVYIYKDCNTNNWHHRVTGGAGSANYRGSTTSNYLMKNIKGFSIEANDSLSTINTKKISYVLKVGSGGQDGIDFTLNRYAKTCFRHTAPTYIPVFAGKNKQKMTGDFSLETLLSCN